MDGNGRWARSRRLPRHAGHRAGVNATRGVVEQCGARDIGALTLFAFSSENWRRPRSEVGLLMDLFLTTLQREANRLHENGVRLRFIGDQSVFSAKLRNQIASVEAQTSANTGLSLNIAANYGGRWDIARAARHLGEQIEAGRMRASEITADTLAAHVCLAELPEPDLLIRTGGEQRVSNFLLWQLAYTELYFTDRLWPDFDGGAFDEALADYAARQRRFGRTGEQVEDRRENA